MRRTICPKLSAEKMNSSFCWMVLWRCMYTIALAYLVFLSANSFFNLTICASSVSILVFSSFTSRFRLSMRRCSLSILLFRIRTLSRLVLIFRLITVICCCDCWRFFCVAACSFFSCVFLSVFTVVLVVFDFCVVVFVVLVFVFLFCARVDSVGSVANRQTIVML